MTQQSLGLMIALQGRITAQQYEAILQDQLLPIIQTLFHNDDPVFQDDNVFSHTHCYTNTKAASQTAGWSQTQAARASRISTSNI